MSEFSNPLDRLAAESNPPSALTPTWEFEDVREWLMRDRAPYQFNGDNAVFELSLQPTFLRVISGALGRPRELYPQHLLSPAYLSSLLDPYESAYWWPRVLVSLNSDGDKSSNRFAERYPALINRSKLVILTFDSGGFTARNLPPGSYYTPQRLAYTLRIMERFGDWSLIFDHPTFCKFPFQDCLDETVQNLDWLRDHMEGRTRFINICQGPGIEQSIIWWNAVKAPTLAGEFPGIAYAIIGMSADVMLELMRQQIDEGAFDFIKRVHVLAANKPKTAILLSIIQRVLREHINPEIEVTFDSALAFEDAGRRYLCYDGLPEPCDAFGSNIVSRLQKFLIGRKRPLDEEVYLNSPVFPPDTPIKVGEILQVRRGGKIVLDSLGLSVLCAHNAWQQINQLLNAYDEAGAVFRLPKFHQHMDTNRAELFRAVADALDETDSVEPALAQFVAAHRLTDLSGELPESFRFFPQHHLEDFQIAAEAVEAILVGPKPDEALKAHRHMFAKWF